jgi:hypothetical protein
VPGTDSKNGTRNGTWSRFEEWDQYVDHRDEGRKRAVHEREGVREPWMADADAQSITALRRPRAGAGLTDVPVSFHEYFSRDSGFLSPERLY